MGTEVNISGSMHPCIFSWRSARLVKHRDNLSPYLTIMGQIYILKQFVTEKKGKMLLSTASLQLKKKLNSVA
jgi:hypothetical protein